jgi:hypothetical protein
MARATAIRAARHRMGKMHFRKLLPLGACLAPLWLAACQEGGFEASVPSRMAPGVPIAVESVEGPPAELQTALTNAVAKAAAAHEVTMVDDGAAARFHLRGYLTPSTGDDGRTTLAYVWDVFDTANQRAQRVTGTEEVAVDPSDPWSGVDERRLQRIANKSMDGIADFLASAGTAAPPVLTAKLSPRTATGGAAIGKAIGAGKPLGYAPTE